ncbi:hypothetical protein ACIA49_38995 [Kribbella sp. NPDC051587]|uniref:hypothetical protein n=1 Tax=Kribbella sp. NPDC051587 TaxID=3364119 RepID=UPI0037A8D429
MIAEEFEPQVQQRYDWLNEQAATSDADRAAIYLAVRERLEGEIERARNPPTWVLKSERALKEWGITSASDFKRWCLNGSHLAASYGLRLPTEFFPTAEPSPFGDYDFDHLAPADMVNAHRDINRRNRAIEDDYFKSEPLTEEQRWSHTAPGDISFEEAGEFVFSGVVYSSDEWAIDPIDGDLVRVTETQPGADTPSDRVQNLSAHQDEPPVGAQLDPAAMSLRDRAQAYVDAEHPATQDLGVTLAPSPPSRELGL